MQHHSDGVQQLPWDVVRADPAHLAKGVLSLVRAEGVGSEPLLGGFLELEVSGMNHETPISALRTDGAVAVVDSHLGRRHCPVSHFPAVTSSLVQYISLHTSNFQRRLVQRL